MLELGATRDAEKAPCHLGGYRETR